MATLNILSNLEMLVNGLNRQYKQGDAADGFNEPFQVTVSGITFERVGSLATATVITLWDDDNQFPADWDFGYLWADQDVYLQLIGATANVTIKVEAKVPLWIPGFDSILPAANTTLITGGTEPTMEDIDSIALGNYSGSAANYAFVLID